MSTIGLAGWKSISSFKYSTAAVTKSAMRPSADTGRPSSRDSTLNVTHNKAARATATHCGGQAKAPNAPRPETSGTACSPARLTIPAAKTRGDAPITISTTANAPAPIAAAIVAERGGDGTKPDDGRHDQRST